MQMCVGATKYEQVFVFVRLFLLLLLLLKELKAGGS